MAVYYILLGILSQVPLNQTTSFIIIKYIPFYIIWFLQIFNNLTLTMYQIIIIYSAAYFVSGSIKCCFPIFVFSFSIFLKLETDFLLDP